MATDTESEPLSVTIVSPVNNAHIRNAEIDVSGTTPIQLPIVLRMYSGITQVATASASSQGNRWSARIRGTYAPGVYRIEVTQSGPVDVTVNLRVTPVEITLPLPGEVPSRQFTVSGRGGEYGVGVVTVHNAAGNGQLAVATIQADGTWTASVALPSEQQPLTFYARQKIGTYDSANSTSVTVALALTAPIITVPAANSLQEQTFILGGNGGRAGATIQVVDSTGKQVGISGALTEVSWECSVTVLGGRVSLVAKLMLNGKPSPPSQPRAFKIKPPTPSIESPDAGSKQLPTFNVAGGGGLEGAIVYVLDDFSKDEVGRSQILTGVDWQCPVTVSVGRVSLVAMQEKDTEDSSSSTARFFDVAPPALANIKTEVPRLNTVKFSGAGHTGAWVVITVVSGPGGVPPPSVEVKSNAWETTAINWQSGRYSLSAIQRVTDNAGGWITSQPLVFSFAMDVPDPTHVTYTQDYTPTFSGNGVTGATVMIRWPGGAIAAPDALVGNGRWSSRANALWGPVFERSVHLKQRLNGLESSNWLDMKVTIEPLAPVITSLVDNELSPNISGTCWRSGAVVNLVFSDNSVKVETASVTGGTWTFRRTLPFETGVTHTVTVTQVAAQQTSPSATRTFEVRRTLLKPVITHPTSDSEVERDLTVLGTQGMAGASMQLRVNGINAGSAVTLPSDGNWSIDLKGLAFGRRIIDAQQTLDGRPPELSDPVAVSVVLMPPLFMTPQPGGKLPRISTISGEGMPGAMVEAWLDGCDDFLFKDVSVNADGRWQCTVTLPVGVTKLRARQAFGQVISRDSPLLTYDVVPAAPYIETPVKEGHVGRSTVVSGFGVPGDTVTILLDAAELGSAPVLLDRTWSVPVSLTQPGGAHVLVAVASYDGFESDQSAAQPVELGSYVPVIDSPPTGGWVSDPVTFSGQGRPGIGQLVSWFNPELPWAPDLAVSAQGWGGTSNRALPVGGNWCRFKQTITDGADASTISDWCESGRFDVFEPPSR